MKKIAIHLATGFEETEAVSIIDVLRRAKLDVTIVSVTENVTVTGGHQISILADSFFSEIDYSEIDAIVLPGGMPGAKNLDIHEELKKKIIEFNNSKKLLGAICAAPLVFGHLGILKNKKAVCYPGFENELHGAEIHYSPTIVSDNIVTGRGVGVALQFALQLVEELTGKETAQKLAKAMLVD